MSNNLYNSEAQKQKVLSYLLAGNTLTQRQATQMFNVIRLAAIIFVLRKTYIIHDINKGLKIESRYRLIEKIRFDENQKTLF